MISILSIFLLGLCLFLLFYLLTLLIAYISVSYQYTKWFSISVSFSPFFQLHFKPFHFQKTTLDLLNLSLKPNFPLIITSLSATQLSINWKLASTELPQISFENLEINIRISNKSDWDFHYGKDLAQSRKHALANYLTSLIENVQTGPTLSFPALLIDYFLRHINLKVMSSHIIFEDPTAQYLLHLSCQEMELLPANRIQIKENTETSPNMSNFYTIGFDQFEILIECIQPPPISAVNNTTATNPKQRQRVITVSKIRFTLEFPSIFKTMFQPARRPNGKLKRIKCGMNCENVKIRLHQMETNILIYAFSHIFGGVDNGYRKWQSVIQEGCTKQWEESVISQQIKSNYIQQYRLYHSFDNINTNTVKSAVLEELLTLEENMSLSTIMSLRRQACDWKFEELIHSTQDVVGIPLLKYNGDPQDPDCQQNQSMAAYISSKKPNYDDLWAVLREIQFYSRSIEQLQIELYSGNEFGSQNAQCASLIAERAKFSLALLLCRNPEYPNGSIGATDEICEPLFPWFQCDMGMSNFNISLLSGTEKMYPSVFLETQYGCHSQDIDKWQGNIDFACESTGAMVLRVECRDTVFNGCMNSEIWYTLNIFNQIVSKPFVIPTITLEEYFPSDCYHIHSLSSTEDTPISISIPPKYPSLDPASNHLILGNLIIASIFHFSNVVILFPDLENLPKVSSLESNSNTPASFALRFDSSCRVLSGQNKEEFNITFYRVEFKLLPCMYFPLSSRIYGHYQWVDAQMGTKISPLLIVEKIDAKYHVHVDDCLLLKRRFQNIRQIIEKTWGNLKSRLSVKVEAISLLEYTNGRLISIISSPTLDLRIKQLNSEIKLAPTVHLHSLNKNTRSPIFQETAQFLIDDFSSYPADPTSPINPLSLLIEILLIDDSSKDRMLVAWCQVPTNLNSGGQVNSYPLIECNSRMEIGQIRLTQELSTPLVQVYINQLRDVDFDSVLHKLGSQNSGVHIAVIAECDAVDVSNSNLRSQFKSTSTRAACTTIQFEETIFFAHLPGTTLRLKFELRNEEGFQEPVFGTAVLTFSEGEFLGELQMKDEDKALIGNLSVEIRWLSHLDMTDISSPRKILCRDEIFGNQVPQRFHHSKIVENSRRDDIDVISESDLSFEINHDSDEAVTTVGNGDGNGNGDGDDDNATEMKSHLVRTVKRTAIGCIERISLHTSLDQISSSLDLFNRISKFQTTKKLPESLETPIVKESTSTTIHQYSGKIIHRCGDCMSSLISSKLLKSYPNLAALLSDTSPTTPLTSFWNIFQPTLSIENSTPLPPQKYDKFMIREIQKKMVLACLDYDFAIDAWGLLVAPLIFGLPRIGNISTSTRISCCQILSPVTNGSSVYVDSNSHIVSLGELASIPLSGIRTSKGDVVSNSSKYLNFLVSDSCTIFVCWPEKSKISKWLTKRGFFLTNYKVTTSTSSMIVFAKQFHVASLVTLGGCGNASSKYDNYFVLLSKSFFPSYAKVKLEEEIRFQLSINGCRVLQDIGNLKLDLSIFQWNLHLDTYLFDSTTQSCAFESAATTTTSAMMDNTSIQEFDFMSSPLQARTRFIWQISFSLDCFSLNYNYQPDSASLLHLQMKNFSLHIDGSHIEGYFTGVIPRLDFGLSQLEFELSLKVSGCPQLPSEEQTHLKFDSDLWLTSSQEYLLEPIFIALDVMKEEGRSKLMVKFGSQSHIILNISPLQLYVLYYFSLPIVRLLTEGPISHPKNEEIIQHSNQQFQIVDIIVENQLGQDIHLKVIREDVLDDLDDLEDDDDDEDDQQVFHCTISADSAVKFGFPLLSNENSLENITLNVETDGWCSITNILLSLLEVVEVYPIRPRQGNPRSRTNSYCSDEWDDANNGSTWQNSESAMNESRHPLSKKLSSLLDDLSGSFQTQDNIYGVTVKCKPISNSFLDDSLLSEKLVDCGLIFRNENLDSDSDLESEGIPQSNSISDLIPSTEISAPLRCTLLVTLSSNISLVNSAECCLNVTVPDDHEDISFELESGEVKPLPLQALHPSKSFFSLQKVWGLDKWLPDPFDVNVSHHSFSKFTPPRLRISRDQENQSIWISALDTTPSLFQGSKENGPSQSDNILPVDDTDENSAVDSDREFASEVNGYDEMLQWKLEVYPAISFTNALPCSLDIQLTQPPVILESLEESVALKSSEIAVRELFFLPNDFDLTIQDTNIYTTTNNTKSQISWEPFQDNDVMMNSFSVTSGSTWQLPCYLFDRDLYFRVSISGTNLWSKVYVFCRDILSHRSNFRKHKPEDLNWNYLRHCDVTFERGPQIKFKRLWKLIREVVFFSDYWIINKTGLALFYETKQIPNKGGDEKKNEELLIDSNEYKTLLFTKTEYSDSIQKQFMRNLSIPILLTCHKRRLRIMPYCMMKDLEKNNFYIYNLKSNSGYSYLVHTTVEKTMKLYSDETWVITSLPESMKSLKNLIYLQTPNKDHDSDPLLENHLSFKVSSNCYVLVCIDTRCRKIPYWMTKYGFLSTGERIRSTNSKTAYQIYKKFYRSHDCVRLGGNGMKLSSDSRGVGTIIDMYLIFITECPLYLVEPTLESITLHDSVWKNFIKPFHFILKPQLKVGDSIFLDSDISITRLPSLLSHISLLGIQTCDQDKYLSYQKFLELTIQHPTRLYLCLDSNIDVDDYPLWISLVGFKITGLQVETCDRTYLVLCRLCGVEKICIGTLSCHQNNVTNYFLILANEHDFQINSSTLSNSSPFSPFSYSSSSSSVADLLGPSSQFQQAIGLVSDKLDLAYTMWNGHQEKCILQKPSFDDQGRHWSPYFDVAPGNSGELRTTSGSFSVQVNPLPGLFHRTNAVTLFPRFIIVNQLPVGVHIQPILSTYSPSGICSVTNNNNSIDLSPNCSGVIYAFTILPTKNSDLHEEVEIKSQKRWICVQELGSEKSMMRCAAHPISLDDLGEITVWLPIHSSQDHSNTFGGESECKSNSINGRINGSEVEGDGENCLSSQLLISVTVMLQDNVVVVTLKNASSTPPYRLENHSLTHTLEYRQVNNPISRWKSLHPGDWKSFVWDDPYGSKYLELRIANTDSISEPLCLDEIGYIPNFSGSSFHIDLSSYIPKALMRKVNDQIDDFSIITSGIIGGYIYANGITRVLILNEVSAKKNSSNLFDYLKNSPRDHNSRMFSNPNQSKSLTSPSSSSTSSSSSSRSLDILLRSLHLRSSICGIHFNIFHNDLDLSFQEVLSINIEGFLINYSGQQPCIEMFIYHIQIDDMRKAPRFPVIFVPTNSGYNSHLSDDGIQIPFIQMRCQWKYGSLSTDILHLSELQTIIQPINLKIDLELLMFLAKIMGKMIQETNRHSFWLPRITSEASSMRAVINILSQTIDPYILQTFLISSKRPIYIELFHYGSLIIYAEFHVGKKSLKFDSSQLDDSVAIGFAVLGTPVLSYITRMIGTIAHVSPILQFKELIISNYFGIPDNLLHLLIVSLTRQAVIQSIKVFGSMELIGDPMSLFNNVGTGVADFFSKTRSEMIGQSKTKGEGIRRLAQAILTSTLASTSKITGSLEEILKNAAGLQDEDSHIFEDRQIHTESISSGLLHGGDVFVNSIVTGFSGLVEAPIHGFQKNGLPGVVTGSVKGLVGLVAAPVSGALGAVSIVTESARQSAQFHHSGRPVGRRRSQRRSVSLQFLEINKITNSEPKPEQVCLIQERDWTTRLPERYQWKTENS